MQKSERGRGYVSSGAGSRCFVTLLGYPDFSDFSKKISDFSGNSPDFDYGWGCCTTLLSSAFKFPVSLFIGIFNQPNSKFVMQGKRNGQFGFNR